MKTVAAMMTMKEWDVNATDCTMFNDRITYPLRSHNHAGYATRPREYMSRRYFLRYSIVYHATLEM